jgi:hypothetical protein
MEKISWSVHVRNEVLQDQGRKEYSAYNKMEEGLAAPNVILVESKHRYLQ